MASIDRPDEADVNHYVGAFDLEKHLRSTFTHNGLKRRADRHYRAILNDLASVLEGIYVTAEENIATEALAYLWFFAIRGFPKLKEHVDSRPHLATPVDDETRRKITWAFVYYTAGLREQLPGGEGLLK